MTRSLPEDSLILYHAKTLVEGLILIDQPPHERELTEEEKDIVDKSIDILRKALSGHDIVSSSENKLAPDAESLEVLNYLSSALALPSVSEENYNEMLRSRIINSIIYLNKLKNNEISESERKDLRTVIEAFAIRVLRESTVPHFENDVDLIEMH